MQRGTLNRGWNIGRAQGDQVEAMTDCTSDALDFATEWPMHQVTCAPSRESSGDGLSTQGDQVRSMADCISDTLSFATEWPMCRVTCASSRESWGEGLSEKSISTPLLNSSTTTNSRSTASSEPSTPPIHHPTSATSATYISSCRMTTSVHDMTPRLPPELMAMVISQMLVTEPRCALGLVAPDWHICGAEADGSPRRSPGLFQVVTYTRGMEFRTGALSCSSSHGDGDHILTHMADLDPNVMALNAGCAWEHTRELYRRNTHVFTPATSDMPEEIIDEIARSLGIDSDRINSIPRRRSRRSELILPFDDESPGITKPEPDLFTVPLHCHLRHIVVYSPLRLMDIDAETLSAPQNTHTQREIQDMNYALDRERWAHLRLSWSQMPQLESVFLDLRLYSHDLNTRWRCLSKYQIMDRAAEMGRHLQLRTLVLCGLQSYSFYTTYKGLTAQDIERENKIGDQPNWIRIFRPALREGGRIVLVDRPEDVPDSDLPAY